MTFTRTTEDSKWLESEAVFSDCELYRYKLKRVWDRNLPACLFIMLNPSTACEAFNDPTIERCERFARRWGYGTLLIGNVFAYRATLPADMKAAPEPVGPDNNEAIISMARDSVRIVCAWGNGGSHLDRSTTVRAMLHCEGIEVYALKLTKSLEPSHPLYLRQTLIPLKYHTLVTMMRRKQ